jgi:cell division protein FtsB
VRPLLTLILIGLLAALAVGCNAAGGNVTRLREENAQLAETLRQDRVRLANLEEQNRQLTERLADAEKSVALLHDGAGSDAIKRR